MCPVTMRTVGLSLVGATVLVACTGAPARPPSPAAPARVPQITPFVRPCSSVITDNPPSHWERRSLVVGPIGFDALPSFADAPASTFAARGHRYPAQKILVIVTGQHPVTVTIPPNERGTLALLYDPSAWGHHNLFDAADGEAAVTFDPCRSRASLFGGYFIVAGPRCVAFQVQVEGQPPQVARASFGAGGCD